MLTEFDQCKNLMEEELKYHRKINVDINAKN